MVKPIFARDFFRGPCLSGNAARTFRLHLAYALLDATAGGILLNAPLIAIKSFQAANWHLPLREIYSGLGMLLALYLGSRMASRRKMPFIFIPGVAAAVSSMAMATATGSAFWFLTLLGVGALFEIVTRPAITAVLRLNYPVEQRGHATGEVRKWSSLCFVASSVTAAVVLHLASQRVGNAGEVAAAGWASEVLRWSAEHMAQVLMVLAGFLSLASFVCFRQIHVEETIGSEPADRRLEIGGSFREAVGVLAHDGRYRRYLIGCFLDGFFQMLYFPLIWSLLSRDLGFGYVSCNALMHALPALVAFFATGWLGKLFDRTNPWLSWAYVRFVWGLECAPAGRHAAARPAFSTGLGRPARCRPSLAWRRARGMVDSVVADRNHALRAPGRRYEPLHGHHGLSQWDHSLQRVGRRNDPRRDGRLAPDAARRRWNRRHFLGFLFALSSRC